jgi:hypothetical protein
MARIHPYGNASSYEHNRQSNINTFGNAQGAMAPVNLHGGEKYEFAPDYQPWDAAKRRAMGVWMPDWYWELHGLEVTK